MQKNVLEYLEHTAAAFPAAAAFQDDTRQVCFSELLCLSRKIGSALISRFGIQKRPMVMLTRRSVSSLIGFFGILSAGTCYVPLDIKMPRARMDSVLEQLQPAAVLYAAEDAALAEELSAHWETVSLETAETAPEQPELLAAARAAVLDTDPVYILFTSGSTGVPKGILVAHRSVIDFTDWYASVTGAGPEDRLGNQAPFFFDLSVKDVYLALKTGACAVILPQKVFSFPTLLADALNRNRVTILSWATSAFHLVAASGVLEKHKPEYLRMVLLGGEALQAVHLNRWQAVLPEVQYVNLYGPTEVTVDCTCFPITRKFSDDEKIPIGRACANMEVFLLKADGTPAAVGEEGEICVRGTGLAIGYWNDPEKTAAAFVQDPRNPYYPDRIYRTGDFGSYDAEGNILFAAREDEQIKHMGYRIELQEIESVIYRIPTVRSAVCMHEKTGDRLICVYAGGEDADALAAKLRRMLPKYMIPNRYFRLDALPQNANGKIDRVSLKKEYLC